MLKHEVLTTAFFIRLIFLSCSISFVKCFVKKYGLTVNKVLADIVILTCSVVVFNFVYQPQS